MAAFNPWETEAMASYSSPLNIPALPPKESTPPEEPEEEPLETEGVSATTNHENKVSKETEEGDKDWVVVEKPGNDVGTRKGTREMTDTEFHRVFRLPLTHSFGRGNTSPMRNENYLKTFNVKAPKAEVYTGSLRANPRRTATRSRPRAPKVVQPVVTSPKDTKGTETKETISKPNTIAEDKTEQSVDKDNDDQTADDNEMPSNNYLRGDPSAIFNCVVKSMNSLDERRNTQLSMFEALSWPLPEEERRSATLGASKDDQTISTKDPKNYAYVDPKAIDAINPAGLTSPKSEPLVRLT